MKLDELTQTGWADADDYFLQTDLKYGTAEMKIPAVVKPEQDELTATPAPTTFGELMETLHIVPEYRKWHQGLFTKKLSFEKKRLGSGKPQSRIHIVYLPPNTELNSLPKKSSRSVESMRNYRGTLSLKKIT